MRTRTSIPLLVPGLLGLLLGGSEAAEAQPPLAGLTAWAAPLDARAVERQPAALPWLGGTAFSLAAGVAGRGTGLDAAGGALRWGSSLPFGLGAGLGAEAWWEREVGRGGARIRAALGWAGARSWALGFGLQGRWGLAAGAAARLSLDLGWAWRPAPWLALSLRVREVEGWLQRLENPGRAAPSLQGAAAWRPTGRRGLLFEARADWSPTGRWRGSGLLAWGPRGGGRWLLEAGAEREPRAGLHWWATLGVRWWPWGRWRGEVAAGVLRSGAGWGAVAEAGWDASLPPEAPLGRGYVLGHEVVGRLGPRRLVRLVIRLESALRDEAARALWIRLRGSGLRWAGAQELRHLFLAWRARGRRVYCQLDDASGAEWYACAAADEVWVDPAGGARLVGPGIEALYVGGLMERLGLRADFVRTGSYKTAAEPLQRHGPSEASRSQRARLLGRLMDRLAADVASDRGLSEERARRLVLGGPYLAEELLERGLADRLVDPFDPEDALAEALGRRLPLRSAPPPRAEPVWGRRRSVALLVVDGTLTEGRNVDVPWLEVHTSGARTLVRVIERLAADGSVGAVLLRVHSPGGSALASDQVWRALRRLAERKPLLASLGPTAASGGYYVASAASRIWTLPSAWTGSIGVIYGKVDAEGLLRRLGVGVSRQAPGPHAGFTSPFRPFSAEQRRMLKRKIERVYDLFLRRVAEGRDLDLEHVRALAAGRLYTGDEAVRLGLADEVGGLVAALDAARRAGGMPYDAPVRVVPRRPSGLLELLLGTRVGSSAEEVAGPWLRALRPALRAAWPWLAAGPGAALALPPERWRWEGG